MHDLLHFGPYLKVNLILADQIEHKSKTEDEYEQERHHRPYTGQKEHDEVDELACILRHLQILQSSKYLKEPREA